MQFLILVSKSNILPMENHCNDVAQHQSGAGFENSDEKRDKTEWVFEEIQVL